MAPDPLMERARRLVLQFPFGTGGFNGVKVLDEVSYQSPTTPPRIGILLAAEQDGDADVLFRDTGEIETVKWNSLFPVIGRLRRLPEQDVKVKEEPMTREEELLRNLNSASEGSPEFLFALAEVREYIEGLPRQDGLVKQLRVGGHIYDSAGKWLIETKAERQAVAIACNQAVDRISAQEKQLAMLQAALERIRADGEIFSCGRIASEALAALTETEGGTT